MKIQLQTIDLLEPWPTFRLRDGYHALAVLVRIGDRPVGEVLTRPVRSGLLTPRRLRRRIARQLGRKVLRVLAEISLAAGPDQLKAAAEAAPDSLSTVDFTGVSDPQLRRLVEAHVLLETGLPEPWRGLIEAAQRRPVEFPTPAVTVAVCTRDRVEHLSRCIAALQELDYPEYEILVVDNSVDPAPTRELCRQARVRYIREPRPGLSLARNAALAATPNRWVAFTDDDCIPQCNWLIELVRKLQDTNCRCVTGLVLPAQLESSAEIAFEIYGGLGRGYADKAFTRRTLSEHPLRPAETWRMGAGANMLIDADLARELGGFDPDLGAGSPCPCSEDTLMYYQILRRGHSIHYSPRAIVLHHHRSTDEALRRQIYNYAAGHAAYHVRCLFGFGDYRSLLQLVWHLPRWFVRNWWNATAGRTRYPRALVPIEARGTLVGVFAYIHAKARRAISRRRGQSHDASTSSKSLRAA